MPKTVMEEIEEIIQKHNITCTVMDEKDFDESVIQTSGNTKSVVIRFDDNGNATGYTVYP